ncbi:LytR family transcriptional regulator [Mangrovactinospora gilvigrisea]|uniref:LytR family transcriptional regulator n=1 Tax=Mangrovactinospora gilvigrisea TaxID=1428644 RepID=A0A1J7BIX2_9ACTN|nr:LCP family protein [Mangrovactinospora gilvigrisea]OIV38623.1 LytR family transcriptional regulator [Mangrovactinospora gilvigrisea]
MATGDVDPADQWVRDPATGEYQLRSPGDTRPMEIVPAPPVPAQSGGHGHGRGGAGGGGGRSGGGGGGGRSGGRPGGRAARRRGGKGGRAGKRRVLPWVAGTVAFVLIGGAAAAYGVYQHFNGNINSMDVHPGGSRADDDHGPLNILILGTDSRKGLGSTYGDTGSVGHADTTILLHVSADRSNATAVSIPRDLITDVPECQTGNKTIPGSKNVQFNTSLGQDDRDPGCTWKTTEQLMGITINHFMMVNFEAVKTLSDAVGGVPVCAAHDIDDPKSHLHMTAGRHIVKGDQALAFVRTRHSVGFGGDLTRIPLQQQFLSSLIRKIKSNGTLTDPTKLWSLADAATKALTVDSGIGSIAKLEGLARDLGDVDTKNITFATVPVIDDPNNKNWVVLKPGDAQSLFRMVREDESLTAVKKKKAAAAKKAAANGPAARVAKANAAAAAEVRVKVVNGSGVIGQAQETIDWMQNQKGYRLSSNGLNAAPRPATTLVYAPGQEAEAKRLVEDFGLPDSALKPSASAGQQLVLTLGKDFTSPGTPVQAPKKAPADLQHVQANDTNQCAK